MRKVRRSGSAIASTSRASLLFHLRPGEIAREFVPKRDIGRAWPARKFFRTERPARRRSAFSRRVNSVGSRPSMKRENICSSSARARSQLFVKAILNKTREGVVESVRKGEGSSAVTLAAGNGQPGYARGIPSAFLRFGVSVKAEAKNIPP